MKRKYIDEAEEIMSSWNHGRIWQRGKLIGKGSCASVFKATLKPQYGSECNSGFYIPSVMAVKSAEVSVSDNLQKEKQAYDNIDRCASLITCYGEDVTVNEQGLMIYNLLLEFASGGSLADKIKQMNGKGLPENEVKRYTRSILRGLVHIHQRNYVHCNLNPANILLVPNSTESHFVAKIGDLGLAKKMSKIKKEFRVRGTLMYLAPEALVSNLQEPSCDIWALGCLVLEMLTGKNLNETHGSKTKYLRLISNKDELPQIPDEILEEGKEFLKRCFVRNPKFRSTAKTLLFQRFVSDLDQDEDEKEEDNSEHISKWQRISSCVTTVVNNGGRATPPSSIIGV